MNEYKVRARLHICVPLSSVNTLRKCATEGDLYSSSRASPEAYSGPSTHHAAADTGSNPTFPGQTHKLPMDSKRSESHRKSPAGQCGCPVLQASDKGSCSIYRPLSYSHPMLVSCVAEGKHWL